MRYTNPSHRRALLSTLSECLHLLALPEFLHLAIRLHRRLPALDLLQMHLLIPSHAPLRVVFEERGIVEKAIVFEHLRIKLLQRAFAIAHILKLALLLLVW